MVQNSLLLAPLWKVIPDRVRLAYTAPCGYKGVRFRSIAPKSVSSFRMQAVSATFFGLPLAHNLSYNVSIVELKRTAQRVII
jgi:hypothetical protein